MSFKITPEEGGLGGDMLYLGGGPPPGKYYYTEHTQILFAIGVVLIIWGVLLYKEKRR